MREFKTALLTTIAIFIVFFLYTKFVGPIPFSVNSVQTTKTDLFTVDGIGEATAVPDTALISLGVTKTASTVLDAQNQTNNVANKLVSDLKKLGIADKDIKTTNYSVYPNYEYLNGQQKINGYTVTQNLEARIKPIELANKAIDTATADGANMVGGVTFVLNDQAQKQLEEKARKQAIQNAKEKAQSIASAAGIKLGDIINVQENSNQPQPRPLMSAVAGGGTEQKSTTLTPGENTVTINITLSRRGSLFLSTDVRSVLVTPMPRILR